MPPTRAAEGPATAASGQQLFVPMPAIIMDAQALTGAERLLRIRLEDGRPLGHAPGQFVQVSIFGREEAPVSICSAPADDGTFELCVRKVGRVTAAMHELKVGQEIGIRGPFGRGFLLPELAGKDVLFIAGGIGLAPLRSLIQWCVGHRDATRKLTLLYGAKRPGEMLFRPELEQWAKARDFAVHVTVDAGEPGWAGHVGLITTLIDPLSLDAAGTVAVIVGPPIMYGFVVNKLTAKGMAFEQIMVSLERHMRCGVGKCGHCMIEHLYCCREGPVFKLSELSGLKGLI
jgi:sulfhydrogenase subunit gamma (sulfur reductase)